MVQQWLVSFATSVSSSDTSYGISNFNTCSLTVGCIIIVIISSSGSSYSGGSKIIIFVVVVSGSSSNSSSFSS